MPTSSEVAIRVEGLGKRYRLGATRRSYRTLRDALSEAVARPWQRLRAVRRGESARLTSETLWALRNVSFSVEPGEVVGVVGRNGAGKTTLLKILSRITDPTEGRGEIYGRVGSLLEVGTGFHPELTGRENVFLNGAILGMRRSEIASKLDDIVAFAEVERFLDTQVKHYSSGMYLRLAFAVAAHLDTEILFVDEVLAVGDAAFQRKCLGKMGDVARAGRTVLFVSHNLEAVQRLCQRCLWIDEGCLSEDGGAEKVVASYLRASGSHLEASYLASASAGGDSRVRLAEAQIVDSAGRPLAEVRFGEPFALRMVWHHDEPTPGAYYFLRVFDLQGRLLFATNHLGTELDAESSGCREVLCRFGYNVMVPGEYSISIGCFMAPRTYLHLVEQCLGLVVLEVPYPGTRLDSPEASLFAPRPSWSSRAPVPVRDGD